MNGSFVDLHAHTTASDGHLTPEALVQAAVQTGLAAIAVTDHDTVAGLPAARRMAEACGIELVSGIELSAYLGPSELHILGLLIEEPGEQDRKFLDELVQKRAERAEGMVEKLRRAGCRITWDHLQQSADEGNPNSVSMPAVIGRPHIAHALIRAGDVRTFSEAFRRYLSPGRPGYLPKSDLSPEAAMDFIHRLGGVAALAHPGPTHHDDLIPRLVVMGLDALEVWHNLHSPPQVEYYMQMAKKHGIAITGGSDFHGMDQDTAVLGKEQVPGTVLDGLKARNALRQKKLQIGPDKTIGE